MIRTNDSLLELPIYLTRQAASALNPLTLVPIGAKIPELTCASVRLQKPSGVIPIHSD